MTLYVPHGPVAMTMDIMAKLLGTLAVVQTFLGAATQAAALKRILPGDGGFLTGEAGAWDGTNIACAPPVIIIEAQAPEYTQETNLSWRVTHQIDMHLIHPLPDPDLAIDAYLRAWDEHNDIQKQLRAAVPNILTLNGVFTAQAPAVFGTTAPLPLQRHYLSTIAARYTKGQP